MTKEKWAEQVLKDYRRAGFSVRLYEGWPFVMTPDHATDIVSMLKFRPMYPVVLNQYHSEGGWLVMPQGDTVLIEEK
jgi:hypothetical protein